MVLRMTAAVGKSGVAVGIRETLSGQRVNVCFNPILSQELRKNFQVSNDTLI